MKSLAQRIKEQLAAQKPRVKAALVSRAELLTLTISGQVCGGKNNMGVTRTGKHYPKPEFVKWRGAVLWEIKNQLPRPFTPFAQRCLVQMDYVATDNQRRDFPAVCDALWHVLEKAGVVTDDTLLWVESSTRKVNKDNPGVTLRIRLEQ